MTLRRRLAEWCLLLSNWLEPIAVEDYAMFHFDHGVDQGRLLERIGVEE